MKKILLLMGLCGMMIMGYTQSVLSKIPSRGASIQHFIPAGFDSLAYAEGDLNADKLKDVVLVLQSNVEKDSIFEWHKIPSRILIVLFRQGKEYILKAKSDSAILCITCGGAFDPLANIEIENGMLTIHHYGGRGNRWGISVKYKYLQNEMRLIGRSKFSYLNYEHCDDLGEFAGTHKIDENFLTGDYKEMKISEEGCKVLINKKGKTSRKPLMKLADLNIETILEN